MKRKEIKNINKVINNIDFSNINKEQLEIINTIIKNNVEIIIPYLKELDNYNFIKDLDTNSKIILAKNGLFHDVLVYDRSAGVRIEIARLGNFQDILCNDINSDVQKIVAKNGNCLDKLVHASSSDVKLEVAKWGYGLDILINDLNNLVVHYVNQFLNEHNITINEYIENKDYWYNVSKH